MRSDRPPALSARVPDAVRHRFDGPHDAVWLVANNPRLAHFALEELPLTPASLLVQFNGALWFERLAGLDCRKDFIFNAHAGGYHGFAAVGEPARHLAGQRHQVLRVGLYGGEPEPHRAALQASLPGAGCLDTPYGIVVMRGYPRRLVASVGFVLLQVHLAIEADRMAAGLDRRPVHLVGFTGYGPKAWSGHDWWAEQQALSAAPVTRHAMDARASAHGLRAARWWLHHRWALRHGRKA